MAEVTARRFGLRYAPEATLGLECECGGRREVLEVAFTAAELRRSAEELWQGVRQRHPAYFGPAVVARAQVLALLERLRRETESAGKEEAEERQEDGVLESDEEWEEDDAEEESRGSTATLERSGGTLLSGPETESQELERGALSPEDRAGDRLNRVMQLRFGEPGDGLAPAARSPRQHQGQEEEAMGTRLVRVASGESSGDPETPTPRVRAPVGPMEGARLASRDTDDGVAEEEDVEIDVDDEYSILDESLENELSDGAGSDSDDWLG